MHDRSSQSLREHRGQAAAGCRASSDVERRGAEPGNEFVGLRRIHVGARARRGEGARRCAAGSLRVGGLWCDDRCRRGLPRRQGGARRDRRSDRLWWHRLVRGERRGDGRGLAHHRDRYHSIEARRRAADGGHRYDQRLECRSSGDGEGDDRRRCAVPRSRPSAPRPRRSSRSRCCVRAARRRSSA